MNIVIATDAWFPQINGVVTTLDHTEHELNAAGHEVTLLTPQGLATLPCPSYPEIRLALFPGRRVQTALDQIAPDAVHIATEGPLGLAARRWCIRRRFPFTSSFHTQFPEYLNLRTGLPLRIGYALSRWFHGRAEATLVPTESVRQHLQQRGFRNLRLWSRGVNTQLFRPRPKDFLDRPRPIFMYVGRVAVEKNVETFLRLKLPGTRYVVGGGPDLEMLRRRYPLALFTGFKTGEDLARHLAAADVFVFPSRTDTFGLVLIEALACGVPVAAYPVQGPRDIIQNGVTGFLDEDLARAALAARALDPQRCRQQALRYTWSACTRQFLDALDSTTRRPPKASAMAEDIRPN